MGSDTLRGRARIRVSQNRCILAIQGGSEMLLGLRQKSVLWQLGLEEQVPSSRSSSFRDRPQSTEGSTGGGRAGGCSVREDQGFGGEQS